jgi:hypothetical protein
MGTKHTPGPWRILPEEDDKEYIRIRGTVWGGFYKITNVPKPQDTGHLTLNAQNLAEVRANAALIAAAPELLEALILAVEDEPNACFADTARAAIAKAKGETK